MHENSGKGTPPLARGYEIKLVLDANYRQFLDGKIDYGVGYLIEKTDIRHRKAVRHSKKMTA